MIAINAAEGDDHRAVEEAPPDRLGRLDCHARAFGLRRPRLRCRLDVAHAGTSFVYAPEIAPISCSTRGLAAAEARDARTEAHDLDAVGDLEHLRQVVGDEDDGQPALADAR